MAETRADVAVVGAGPAGIAAAVTAAAHGRRVVLVDEGLRPGGQIWRHARRSSLPPAASHWLARLDRSGVNVLSGATVVDARPGFDLVIEQAGKALRVAAARLVLTTGARERFLPFPGWTLPGVVGAGGAQALLKSGAGLTGLRTVVAGTGPLLLAVAGLLARSGVDLRMVAEQAPQRRVYGFASSLWRSPARLAQAARERLAVGAARYAPGTWVERAHGGERLEAVTLTDGVRTWTVPCDMLCVGWGLVPSLELARLLGCAIDDGVVVVDDAQRTTVPDVLAAGESTGIGGVDAAVVEGEIAGLSAVGAWPGASRLAAARRRHRRFAVRMRSAFELRPELRVLAAPETLVCRCEDVPFAALAGLASMREARLRTRAGMGPCQGRICGTALEFLLGFTTDTVRPPLSPAAVSTLAATDNPSATHAGDPHDEE